MTDLVIARYARQSLEASSGSGRMSTVDEVRHILFVLLPSGESSIDKVAQQLGVDQRTIQRRLAREGTTFSDVMNAIRRELAGHYLDNGKRPLSQIAELLGFSALSAFWRWHKQQFGENRAPPACGRAIGGGVETSAKRLPLLSLNRGNGTMRHTQTRHSRSEAGSSNAVGAQAG